MLDLAEVKDFLKVDFFDDDNYILLLISVAAQYLKDAVGSDVDAQNPKAKLLMLTIISTLYHNREYTVDTINEKVQRTLRSIVLQLQLEADDD